MCNQFGTLPEDIVYEIFRIIRTFRYGIRSCCEYHVMLEGETCTLNRLVRTSRQLHRVGSSVLYEQVALFDGIDTVGYLSMLQTHPLRATVANRIVFLGINTNRGKDSFKSALEKAGDACNEFPRDLCETWKEEVFSEEEKLAEGLDRGATTAARIRLIESLPNLLAIISTGMAGENDRLSEAFERGTLISSMANVTEVILRSQPGRAFYMDEFVHFMALPQIHSIDVRYIESVMENSTLFKSGGPIEQLRGTSTVKNVSLRGRITFGENWDVIKLIIEMAQNLERLTLVDMDLISIDEMCSSLTSSFGTLKHLALIAMQGFMIDNVRALQQFRCLTHLVITEDLVLYSNSSNNHIHLPESLRILDIFEIFEDMTTGINPNPYASEWNIATRPVESEIGIDGLRRFVEAGGLPKSCIVHIDEALIRLAASDDLLTINEEESHSAGPLVAVASLISAFAQTGNVISGYKILASWYQDTNVFMSVDVSKPSLLWL